MKRPGAQNDTEVDERTQEAERGRALLVLWSSLLGR